MLFLSPNRKPVAAPPGEIITDGLIDLWDYSEQSGSVIGGLNGNDANLLSSSFNGWRTETEPQFSTSYEFDGVAENAFTANITHGVLPDWTIVTWLKMLEPPKPSSYDAVFQNASGAVGSPGLYVALPPDHWGIWWTSAKSAGYSLPQDVWKFLVVVGNKTAGPTPGTTDIILYDDSVEVPVSHNAGILEFPESPIRLGARSSSQSTYCRMAMTRLYGRAITQAEIDLMFAGNG